MGRTIFIILLTACFFSTHYINAQDKKKMSTAENDFFLFDTLLLDPSQIELLPGLDLSVQKTLTYKPKSDGFKTYRFINGNKCSEGMMRNKKKEQTWTTWYDSGQIANKLFYVNDLKEGACEYWYKNGKLNATGQYKNDLKEGEWLFYNKDGTFKGKKKKKKGVLSN